MPSEGKLCLFKLEMHVEYQWVHFKIHKCLNDQKLKASNDESHTSYICLV